MQSWTGILVAIFLLSEEREIFLGEFMKKTTISREKNMGRVSVV